MIEWFKELDPVVQAAIIGAIGGIIVAFINKLKKKGNDNSKKVSTNQNNSGDNNVQIGEQNQDGTGNVQNTYINCNIQPTPQPQDGDAIDERIEKYMQEHEITSEDIVNMFSDNVVSKEKREYLNKNKEGKFTFDYSNNNGEFTIGNDEFAFVTKWSKASDTSIHAYKDALGPNGAVARIKTPSDWPVVLDESCDFSSRVRTPNIGDVIIWRNANNNYAATKIVSIKDDTRGAQADELTCEYVIYDAVNSKNDEDERIIDLGNAKMVKMKNLAGGYTAIIGDEKSITEQIIKEHDAEIEKALSEL